MIDTLLETMEKKPHKNILNMWDDLENNRRPSFSPLRLSRQLDPSELKQQGRNVSDSSLEAQLVRGIQAITKPLEWIPNVRYTECGIVFNSSSVCTDLDTALQKIRGRPIILRAGGELIEGKEEETIKERFSRMRDHDLLFFTACGMYWKKKDDPKIISLHKRLDEYYLNEVYPKYKKRRNRSGY